MPDQSSQELRKPRTRLQRGLIAGAFILSMPIVGIGGAAGVLIGINEFNRHDAQPRVTDDPGSIRINQTAIRLAERALDDKAQAKFWTPEYMRDAPYPQEKEVSFGCIGGNDETRWVDINTHFQYPYRVLDESPTAYSAENVDKIEVSLNPTETQGYHVVLEKGRAGWIMETQYPDTGDTPYSYNKMLQNPNTNYRTPGNVSDEELGRMLMQLESTVGNVLSGKDDCPVGPAGMSK